MRVGRLAAAALLALGAAAAAEAQPARVETVELHSAAVDREMKFEIALPPGYDDPANAERRYPTLYLLHGEGRSFLAWREILGGATDAGGREMILVMPDAGESFYVNWARSDDGRRDDVGGLSRRRRRGARRRALPDGGGARRDAPSPASEWGATER